MRYCRNCNSFYNDQTLRFCLKDGLPLVSVSQEEHLWLEGAEKIREFQKIAKKELRRKQIKKYVSMIITIILVIMVINVIFLNAWYYFIKSKDEVKKEIPQTSNTPITNSTAQPKPTEIVVLVEKSPTPKQTPTIKPLSTATPKITPLPTISPKSSGCSISEIKNAQANITESNNHYFVQSVNNLERKLAMEHFKNNYEIFKYHPFSVSNNAPKTIFKMKNCSNFIVTQISNWMPTTESLPAGIRAFSIRSNFNCSKKGVKWTCEYLG